MNYFKDFRFPSGATFQEVFWMVAAMCCMIAAWSLGFVVGRAVVGSQWWLYLGGVLSGLLLAAASRCVNRFWLSLPPPDACDPR